MTAAGLRPDDLAHLTALVRADDRPRYYATLFAPSAARPDLFAIYGFAAEIARVPDQVSEPALGQIRLEWWREGLKAASAENSERAGEAPAIRAAADLIKRYDLPLRSFLSLADARSADLYSDAPPTLGDLLELFGKIEGALFALGANALGVRGPEVGEASRHSGIAYGLAQRLGALAPDRARGRAIFPDDLLATEHLTSADVFADPPVAGLHNIAVALGKLARHHFRIARTHAAALPRRALPAFLPLSIVEPLLDRVDQADAGIFVRPVRLSDLEMLSRVGWARLRGLGGGATGARPKT